MESAKVVVIGLGYVGLPLALRAAAAGYHVTGIEADPDRREQASAGLSYVPDAPAAALREALDGGCFAVAGDYAAACGFGVAVITVPTPLRGGRPDLSHVKDAARALAPHVTPGCVVVLESTVYPGTTQEIVQPLLERGSGLRAGRDFALGYSPERIDPGNSKWNLVNTPKLVSGVNTDSLRRTRSFYDSLVDETVPVSGCREAEFAKLLENTFRLVNIALVNELAVAAHGLGIDLHAAIDAAATKPFGFMAFAPGPGVGGHCVAVDPSYLTWRVRRGTGRPLRLVELAGRVNRAMPGSVLERVAEMLHRNGLRVAGARVLLLGLAYKRNCGDCRESPALRVAELLSARGATVSAVDGHVTPEAVPSFVKLVELDAATVAEADVVVLLTDHDDVDYGLLTDARLVFDTRGRLRLGERS